MILKILDIIEKLETRINTYWNFYTVVAIATVGWLMSSKTPFSTYQSITLSIALSLFFIANFFVIRSATKRVIAFEDELNNISKECVFTTNSLKNKLSTNIMPSRLIGSYILHGVIDFAVIYAIWSKLF